MCGANWDPFDGTMNLAYNMEVFTLERLYHNGEHAFQVLTPNSPAVKVLFNELGDYVLHGFKWFVIRSEEDPFFFKENIILYRKGSGFFGEAEYLPVANPNRVIAYLLNQGCELLNIPTRIRYEFSLDMAQGNGGKVA